MKVTLQFTIDTEESPEALRDDVAAALAEHGEVIATSAASAEPFFVVHGVNTDRRKAEPEPFTMVVQAPDAAAAGELATEGSNVMVVASVVEASGLTNAPPAEEPGP